MALQFSFDYPYYYCHRACFLTPIFPSPFILLLLLFWSTKGAVKDVGGVGRVNKPLESALVDKKVSDKTERPQDVGTAGVAQKNDEKKKPGMLAQQDRSKSAPLASKPKVPPPPPQASSPSLVRASPGSSMLRKHQDWSVRPGYSSGASSYAGSDLDDDEALSDSELMYEHQLANAAALEDRSRHSDTLALGRLREEIANEGQLAGTVVRIETPFGKPIEEIYDGVHEGPVLGSGVSGIVRLIKHRDTGLKYAVKILDLGTFSF